MSQYTLHYYTLVIGPISCNLSQLPGEYKHNRSGFIIVSSTVSTLKLRRLSHEVMLAMAAMLSDGGAVFIEMESFLTMFLSTALQSLPSKFL